MAVRINWESNWESKIEDQHKPHMSKIANDILKDMQDECPVDTGALRDSLVAEEDNGEWWIGSRDKDYALYEENGTSRIPPKHFMRNALFKTRE